MSFNDQVREIVEHVNEKRSVVVDGKRGSGRSTLVARVAGELERRGRHVLTAAGHRAFSSQPYAGLEMLGFSVGKTPAERQPLVVADMVSRELIASEAGLVTLDDIELFDRLSLDVLDVALDRIGKPWLATVQPPADGADGVRQFLDRWPSARLRMEPLRFDEVRALVASRLSGPISADLIGRVLTLSSGSPLLATEIIDSGALSQEIHRVDGVWQSRSFGVWNRHLESVVNGMLGELQPDEVDALHTMAVLGVEPAARILQVVDAETLASLDRRGMIATLGDDPEDRWLAVDPPLLSEYFRHRSDAVATLIVSRRTDELFGARRSPGAPWRPEGFPTSSWPSASRTRERTPSSRGTSPNRSAWPQKRGGGAGTNCAHRWPHWITWRRRDRDRQRSSASPRYSRRPRETQTIRTRERSRSPRRSGWRSVVTNPTRRSGSLLPSLAVIPPGSPSALR